HQENTSSKNEQPSGRNHPNGTKNERTEMRWHQNPKSTPLEESAGDHTSVYQGIKLKYGEKEKRNHQKQGTDPAIYKSTKRSKSRSIGGRSTRTGTSTRKSTAASERVFDEAEIRETSSDTLDLQFQRVLAGIKEITYDESVELYNVCQKDRFAFNRIMFCRPEERGSTGRAIIEHARRARRLRELMKFKRPSTKRSKSRSTGSRSTRTGTSTWKSTAASERVFDEVEIRETSSDTLDL
nr:hypothetical protein [Tanacetum cinerariifolium]